MFLHILDPPVLDPSQVLDNNYVLQLPLNQQINLIFFSSQAATARSVPADLNIRQGESAEVRCEVSGTPTPVVKWSRMTNPMSQNAEQIGNNLRISNARVEDRGLYICAASNELGLEQAVAHIEVTRKFPGAENDHQRPKCGCCRFWGSAGADSAWRRLGLCEVRQQCPATV